MSDLETCAYVSPEIKPVSEDIERIIRHVIEATAAALGAEAHVEFKTGKTEYGYDKDLGFEREFFSWLPNDHPEAKTKIVSRLYRTKQ